MRDWRNNSLRLELNCGKCENINEEKRFSKVVSKQDCVVSNAKSFGMNGYRETTQDKYGRYSDAYIYPSYNQLNIVLNILKDCDWEGDYLDVPKSFSKRAFRKIKKDFEKHWIINHTYDF